MDGKLLLVTNVQDLWPPDVVRRYKALADIERGFRVLKSDIEIGPVYHRLPQRIRAHALVCFMALILYRVMRMRLKANDREESPTRLLQQPCVRHIARPVATALNGSAETRSVHADGSERRWPAPSRNHARSSPQFCPRSSRSNSCPNSG